MTRGSIYFITDKYIIETIEFNGDMYRNGYGEEVMNSLNGISKLKEFKKAVQDFNNEHHSYDSELFFNCKRNEFINDEGKIDFNDDYYGRFFSDWTFWKNCSSSAVEFLTRDNKTITLEPNEAVAVNFGYEEDCYFGSELEGELKEE